MLTYSYRLYQFKNSKLGPKVLCQITTKNQVHVIFMSLVTYWAFTTYRDVKINKYALYGDYLLKNSPTKYLNFTWNLQLPY